MNQSRNPLGKLLDFSFSSFITPQVVSILYKLVLVNAAFSALNTIRVAPKVGGLDGLAVVVTSILNLLIYAIAARVVMEGVLALIRTSESTRILAENVLNNTPSRDL